jgi:hypothetical protein
MPRKRLPPGPLAQKVFKAIIEVGPRDLESVSRISGIPYYKVVQVFHRAIENFNIRVLASANIHALGLSTAFFEAQPSKEFRSVAFQAFQTLNSLMGLHVNAVDMRSLVGSLYIPRDEKGYAYLKLFDRLKDEGFLESYWAETFSNKLRYSMRPEYFDWNKGVYSFTWESLSDRDPEDPIMVSSESLADKLDLLIIKELEIDAMISFKEISANLQRKDKVQASDRLLMYHFKQHVISRRLLGRYKVFLPPVKTLAIDYVVSVKKENRDAYLRLIRRIPYLSIELTDDFHNYHVAIFNVPFSEYMDFVGYYYKNVVPLTESIRGHIGIPGLRISYTIPFELYDEKQGWVYDYKKDAQKVLEAANKLLGEKQKNSTGGS